MTKRLILTALLSTSLTCFAVGKPRHVFVQAASCTDTVPSAMLTSLREEIRGSNGYQLATSLADDGDIGAVLTIYLNCTQDGEGRSGVAAIAAIYGQAKCVWDSCHVTSNELTLRSMICGANVSTECGRALFRDFDNYWSGPNSPPMNPK